LTGIPYGIIRAMLDPQDEVNARRSKMLWLLSAKRVVLDSDALDQKYNKLRALADEIGRPDAVVILNPDRKNKEKGFVVDDQLDLGQQQFNVMLESKRAIQETGGVFQQMLGDSKGGANSGIAINSLVEQGMTTLAEINDNYRFSRRMVGEKLHKQVRYEMLGKEMRVSIDRMGQKKTIILNKPVPDKRTGYMILENDISRARVRVALEDVPQTPAYKAQLLQMLGEVMKSLPPELQAIIAPHFIESTDLKDRHQIAEQMRKMLGMSDPQQMSPEEQAAAQKAAKVQETAVALELQEMQADIAKTTAETVKIRVETLQMGSEDGGQDDSALETERMNRETDQAERNSQRDIGLKRELAQVDKEKAIEIAKINAAAKKETENEKAKIAAKVKTEKPKAEKSEKAGPAKFSMRKSPDGGYVGEFDVGGSTKRFVIKKGPNGFEGQIAK